MLLFVFLKASRPKSIILLLFDFFIHDLALLRALDYKGCSVLTVEVGGDGALGHKAVDGNLIDDVEQQEGHTGEAEGPQQPPCVA